MRDVRGSFGLSRDRKEQEVTRARQQKSFQIVHNPRIKTEGVAHHRMQNREPVSFGHRERKAARMVGVQHTTTIGLVKVYRRRSLLKFGGDGRYLSGRIAMISNIWINGGVGGQVEQTRVLPIDCVG